MAERDADARDGFGVVPADELDDDVTLLVAQPGTFAGRRRRVKSDTGGRPTRTASTAARMPRSPSEYVDFLRGRYDRAEHWLTDALNFADGSASVTAKAMTYLGAVESDRANYRRARDLLEQAVKLSQAAGEARRQAYGLSMLGRISLFRGDLDVAAEQLDASIGLAERDHWLAFLPWPQALRGEVRLARADPAGAAELLRQAFARACQLGDPCWEGISARGLALVAESTGDTATRAHGRGWRRCGDWHHEPE